MLCAVLLDGHLGNRNLLPIIRKSSVAESNVSKCQTLLYTLKSFCVEKSVVCNRYDTTLTCARMHKIKGTGKLYNISYIYSAVRRGTPIDLSMVSKVYLAGGNRQEHLKSNYKPFTSAY